MEMNEYLFVGGHLHGQIVEVRDGQQALEVPIPSGSARDPQTGLVMFGQRATYMRRTLGAKGPGGVAYERTVYVVAGMGAQEALMAIGAILVQAWLLDGKAVYPEASFRPDAVTPQEPA